MAAEQYRPALSAFVRAYQLEAAPRLLVAIGRAQQQLGEACPAEVHFRRYQQADPQLGALDETMKSLYPQWAQTAQTACVEQTRRAAAAAAPRRSEPVAQVAAPAQLYSIVRWEQRQEYISDNQEWRREIGAQNYRLYMASRALTILGAGTLFGGLCAMLVGFGNLAGSTNYGRETLDLNHVGFESWIYGFGGMAAAGGALMTAGLVMSIPVPNRFRTVRAPVLVRAPQPAATAR